MNSNLDRLLTMLTEQADLIDKIHNRSNLFYKSTYRLVLDHGKPYCDRITPSPFRGKVKQCYKNCFEPLWKRKDWYYCEGYAIDDDLNLAIAHAWLINDAGQVIDPTWRDNISGAVYFGVAFENEYVFEIAKITKCYGILENDYLNGHKLMTQGFPAHALHPKFHEVMVGE
ncbi:MAG: hypothetical protein VKN72_27500 [Nostocales cyanobacterium 94392]|nr:hypothetical protein [Nostocales cyanobacterium 94392]